MLILRITLIVLILGCLCGCSDEDKGLKHFGKEVFKDLNNFDTTSLKKKFYRPSVDTKLVESYSMWVKLDSSGENKYDYKEEKKSELHVHEDIINLLHSVKHLRSNKYTNSHIWEKDLDYLGVKVDTVDHQFVSGKVPEIKVYFSRDSTIYRLEVGDLVKVKKGWRLCTLVNPISEIDALKADARSWKETKLHNGPFHKSLLKVKRYSWRAKRDRFKIFSISMSNESDYNFDEVRIRITMFDESGFRKEKVLSETYEVYNVHEGDVTRSEIEELSGFFPGFDIGNREEWSIESEIEKVAPPPADTPDFRAELSK
jgi:hypothetical protein